ncbi:MAG TPA: DUF6088 family protein [Planktothrix sp.]|jgi:hypothetical protein
MSTTAGLVRDFVGLKIPGELFHTSDLLRLQLGKRGSIDANLSKLVKSGALRRVARGVFARPPTNGEDVPEPTARDVAEVKARAFGKRLISDHLDEARELKLTTRAKKGIVFRVSGRSTKFRFKGQTIYLRGTSNRKLQIGDGRLGKLLRSLWHLGQAGCEKVRKHIEKPLADAASLPGQKVIGWLPAWLNAFVNDVCPLALPRSRIAAA